MFQGSESDRLAIRELLDSVSHAVMCRDADALGRYWHENGTWDFRGARIEGRSAIVETWATAMRDIEAVSLHMFPGSLVIDGNRASMVTRTMEHVVMTSGKAFFLAGTYQDELLRDEDHNWVFTQRAFAARPLNISDPD